MVSQTPNFGVHGNHFDSSLRWGSGNLDRCHPAQFARFRSARGSIPFRSTFIFGVLFPV